MSNDTQGTNTVDTDTTTQATVSDGAASQASEALKTVVETNAPADISGTPEKEPEAKAKQKEEPKVYKISLIKSMYEFGIYPTICSHMCAFTVSVIESDPEKVHARLMQQLTLNVGNTDAYIFRLHSVRELE